MSTAEKKPRTSFSQRVLIGVGLGTALGLFVGEHAAPLKVVGDAYVGLLQMTVLPYIFVSLIGNIAGLSLDGGKKLMRRAGITLLCLWGIGLLTIPILALCYPAWDVGSFFSTSFLEAAPAVDYQKLYIPSNPFHSLAGNLVPAVALFCILAGAVAIGMPKKDRLIEILDVTAELLTRMNRRVVSLTPIGVFGIAAAAAGTLSFQEFGLLQGYLISHAIGVLILVYGVLPFGVSCVTPLGYREVLSAAKEPILTAFVTGSTFVTLPMIVDNANRLLAKKALEHPEVSPDVVVPLGYSFPHLGKVISLIFVPFAAWFYGSSMELGDYPNFLVTGLLGCFGSLVVTIPVLLDQQHLPADIFQLFLLSGVVSARVSDMLGSMHILTFALVTTCWMSGAVRLRARRLFIGLAGIGAVAAVLIGATRLYLTTNFLDDHEKEDLLGAMVSVEPQAVATELPAAAPNPVPLRAGQTRLERIRERGVVRVGIAQDHLPFSFRNADGQLVGFDVDMAHALAIDLGVELEFVPIDVARLEEQLEDDDVDIVMAGIEATIGRSERLYLSDSYLKVTAATIVEDYRVGEFQTIDQIRRIEDLRVAVTKRGYASEQSFRRAPDATIVEIDSVAEFFAQGADFDVLVISAESGSVWTLRHPEYAVVNPLGERIQMPLIYPIAGRDAALREFINHWIELRRGSGLIDRLYDYWVLGKGAETSEPRWSVIRNVLGWVD